ncbi:MAG: NAD(P)-binding protein [Gammaproteobacteria bacterium]|nr:NAD(P)-binding protein [Gammaproteobacteria bacterium]
MKVAIIGAGMAGASAAAWLVAAGAEVEVFDKGRSVGGRMSSKRLDEQHYLDMGAQYFTARDPAFTALVADWQNAGVVAPWSFTPYVFNDKLQISADQERRFVGVPSMQQPIKQLLADVAVTTSCRIQSIYQDEQSSWHLSAEDGREFSGFTHVLVTTPPVQAAALVQEFPELRNLIPDTILRPCWAVVLTVKSSQTEDFESIHPAKGIFVQTGSVRWACQLQDKPERAATTRWLVHFSAEFTKAHLTESLETLAGIAVTELERILSCSIEISESICHRWLFATVDAEQQSPGILNITELPIWLAGDWSFGGRIENAWLAGRQAAEQIWQSACGSTK